MRVSTPKDAVRAAKWNRDNPGRRKEIVDRYSHKNMDKIVAWNRNNPKERNVTIKEGQRKMRQKVIGVLGNRCNLCGRICIDEPRKANSLEFHKRDYKPHPPSYWWYILKHPDEFLPLCKKCHGVIHYLKRVFGISYEEIKFWVDSRKIGIEVER